MIDDESDIPLIGPVISVISGFVAGAFGLVDPLIQFLGSTTSLWWPIATALGTAGTYVPSVPSSLTGSVVAGAVVLYGIVKTRKFLKKSDDRFNL
jgi:hypothetical protein